MRISSNLLSALRDRVPGRLLLPVGFAVVVATGAYVVAESTGYERGKAAQASAQESVRNLARLVAQPIELDEEPTLKGDRQDLPTMIRAIEPSAVYRAPQAARAAGSAKPRPAAEASAAIEHAALPAGVERFDRCEGACETRDPKIVQTSYPAASYPVLTESPEATAARVAAGPNAPPAPVIARADEPAAGLLGLPPLPSAGEIVDRTVQGTTQAYDSMKQAVSGAIDFLR